MFKSDVFLQKWFANSPEGRREFRDYTKSVYGNCYTWFSYDELMSKDGKGLGVDAKSLDALWNFRKLMKTALWITSAYRSAEHNKKIGGRSKSFHLTGQAFDIVWNEKMEKLGIDKVVEIANAAGFNGVIYYKARNFIHLDTRPVRYFKIENR